jgi:uncharacterized membrane protein YeaQ/YmgE (transglycosylase-associated protein family)
MQETIILICGSLAGAIATFILQKNGFSAVLASSIIGIIGVVIGHYLSMSHLPAVIFAGSFVGMTNLAIGSFAALALAGISTGLVYIFSQNIFKGYGGRLGTMAFICTIMCVYLVDLVLGVDS